MNIEFLAMRVIASNIPQELHDFFNTAKGQTLLIKGASGTGKTTFALELISEFARIKQNSVYVFTRLEEEQIMNNFPIQLLADRIIVEQFEGSNKRKSGLIIPDYLVKKQDKGTIVEVGAGTPFVEMELKIGDVVYFNRGAGVEIQIKDKEYLILRQDQVILPLSGKQGYKIEIKSKKRQP